MRSGDQESMLRNEMIDRIERETSSHAVPEFEKESILCYGAFRKLVESPLPDFFHIGRRRVNKGLKNPFLPSERHLPQPPYSLPIILGPISRVVVKLRSYSLRSTSSTFRTPNDPKNGVICSFSHS